MTNADPDRHAPRARRTAARGPGQKVRRAAVLLASFAVLAGAVLLAYRLGWWQATRTVFSSVEAMRELVSHFGAWTPGAFFLAQAAQVVLAPIPGGITVVVGTLLFGVWGGLALSVAGAVVGSAVLFVVVRRWGRPLAVRIVGEGNFGRYAGAFDEKGALLFVVMLVPFMPDDVVVALAGLSAVSLRRFVVLVAIGRTPSWLLTALVTADLATRSATAWAAAGLAVLATIALMVLYRKRLESWVLGLAGKGRSR